MTTPLDDYLLEKQAKGPGKTRFGRVAGDAAIHFGVAAAMMAAPAAVSKIMHAVNKRRNYSEMLEQNPGLGELREQDTQTFNNFYNSFHRLNPEFATNPTVSGAYMSKMMSSPEAAGQILVESLKSRPQNTMPTFGDAWRSGAGAGSKELSRGSIYGEGDGDDGGPGSMPKRS